MVKRATNDGARSDRLTASWQVQEVWKNMGSNGVTGPQEVNVWSPRYVDAPMLRYYDANTDGDFSDTGDSTLSLTTDANGNITGAFDVGSKSMVERYSYTPYGDRIVYSEDWTIRSGGTQYAQYRGHQGLWEDSVTGLYQNRARWYSPTQGRFIGRDPLGYVDGPNQYQYVGGDPVGAVDPEGTQFTGLGPNPILMRPPMPATQPSTMPVAPAAYGTHLTPDQALQLWKMLAFTLRFADLYPDGLGIPQAFLRRYLHFSGDQKLSYLRIKNSQLIRAKNAEAWARAQRGERSWTTSGRFTEADLRLALGGVTIRYTFEQLAPVPTVQPTKGPLVACRVRVRGRIQDRYDFHPDPTRALNVTLPPFVAEWGETLFGWAGGAALSDAWMWDLEKYGMARPYDTIVEWEFDQEPL